MLFLRTHLAGVGVTCSIQCCELVTKFLTGCGVTGVSTPLVGVGVVCDVTVPLAPPPDMEREAYHAPTDMELRADFTTNGCSRSFAYLGRCL